MLIMIRLVLHLCWPAIHYKFPPHVILTHSARSWAWPLIAKFKISKLPFQEISLKIDPRSGESLKVISICEIHETQTNVQTYYAYQTLRPQAMNDTLTCDITEQYTDFVVSVNLNLNSEEFTTRNNFHTKLAAQRRQRIVRPLDFQFTQPWTYRMRPMTLSILMMATSLTACVLSTFKVRWRLWVSSFFSTINDLVLLLTN